jgi:ribosomal protein S18 acetylase RimI-like enzyme
MKKEITYEKGKQEELSEIFDVFECAISEMISLKIYQWDEIYPDIDVVKTDLNSGQLYVGKVEDKVAVVFVLSREWDDEYKNGTWDDAGGEFMVVHRLCVKPTYQHQGIARRTMEYIEQTLRDKNITSIRLDAFTENPYALRLYKSLDYKVAGKANWRKGMFYLMEKKI